jgi:hypothetical protein
MENHPNPHIWQPVILDQSEQTRGELCRLCGVFRNGATPDPSEAAPPCPIPSPTLSELTQELGQRESEILFKCRMCGASNTPDASIFSGKFCLECGSRNGAIRI